MAIVDDRVAEALVKELSDDNGFEYKPTREQYQLLYTGVKLMRGEGCNWTEADITMAASGEEVDMSNHFAAYPSWPNVNAALNTIWEEL